MTDPWKKLSDGYLSEAKPDKSSIESKITSLLCRHPDTKPGKLKVTVCMTGFNSCKVHIVGEVNKLAAEASIFMMVPEHFKIEVTFGNNE